MLNPRPNFPASPPRCPHSRPAKHPHPSPRHPITPQTGTLTKNEMTAVRLRTATNLYHIGGVGYAPFGDFTLCNSAGDGPGDALDGPSMTKLRALVEGALLANDSALSKGTDEATGQTVYKPTGAPTEVALLTAGQKVSARVYEDVCQSRPVWPPRRAEALPCRTPPIHACAAPPTALHSNPPCQTLRPAWTWPPRRPPSRTKAPPRALHPLLRADACTQTLCTEHCTLLNPPPAAGRPGPGRPEGVQAARRLGAL